MLAVAVAVAAAAVVDWVEKYADAAVHVVEGTCLASLLRPGHVRSWEHIFCQQLHGELRRPDTED